MIARVAQRLGLETAGLLAAATLLGLIVNALSPAGIAVTRPLPLKDLDPRFLTTEETKARFEAGQTIFLDARRSDEFVRGHIAGALNFPAEEFTQRYIGLADWLPREAPIVVYCTEHCGLARLLADNLEKIGYKQVAIFHDGWPAWQARGWPTER